MQVFVVPPENLDETRLDAFYYSPELRNAQTRLNELKDLGKVELYKGSNFKIIDDIKKKDEKLFVGNTYKYFEIGDVTIDGTIVKFREENFGDLPTRARLQVKKGDVVFAKNNSSRGTTVIIPDNFDEQLVTTGFIGLRPKNEEEKYLLWGILESEFFRMQIYYLAITASQPEIRDSIFKEQILIPFPVNKKEKNKIVESAKLAESARFNLSKAVSESSDTITKLFS